MLNDAPLPMSARKTLGRYQVICRIAGGGMSEIHLASTQGPGGFRKIVVLKTILPDVRGEDAFVDMFLSEARITAQFNHPHLAQVFDLGVDSGILFLAMEFVQGCTLNELAWAASKTGEQIPLGLTLQVVRDTALALHYAHHFVDVKGKSHALVHRDVAQKNIMVTYEGITKLLDFGLVKALDARSSTAVGMVKGTGGYMSPEQIRGDKLDARTDIFSLGVVLHECLTGEALFHGESTRSLMVAGLEQELAPPSSKNPLINKALDVVTLKALARKQSKRYATALEFARALEEACPGQLWHPEQSGEWVQQLFGTRRQQTHALLDHAVEGTGEVNLSAVFASGGAPVVELSSSDLVALTGTAARVASLESGPTGRMPASPLTALPHVKAGIPGRRWEPSGEAPAPPPEMVGTLDSMISEPTYDEDPGSQGPLALAEEARTRVLRNNPEVTMPRARKLELTDPGEAPRSLPWGLLVLAATLVVVAVLVLRQLIWG